MTDSSPSPESKPKTKGEGSRPKVNQRTTKKRKARKEAFRALMEHADVANVSIRLGVTTGDALQECLDRAVALFRTAMMKVDELDEDEMWELQISPNGATSLRPNRWREMEDAARDEIERLAASMTGLGIAERRVRIEEAQAQLLVATIRDAALAVGIPHDQVRALGAALRERVAEAVIEPPNPGSNPVGGTKMYTGNAKAAQSAHVAAQVGSLGPGH